MENPRMKVAFICSRNAFRSQIAEALGHYYGNDVFDSYSAGTTIAGEVNKDAARLIKEIYGIDMIETQRPKTLDELPQMDIMIGLGCDIGNVDFCNVHFEEWDIEDPLGKDDEGIKAVIFDIEERIKYLTERLITGEIQWNDEPCKVSAEVPEEPKEAEEPAQEEIAEESMEEEA